MTTPAIVSVGGRRTRVRIEGDSQSPPVLLLHGIGRSLEDWAPQYPRLAGSHRVIALDVAGFGFSDRLTERSTLKALAQSVIDTLDALGERRPLHVVGNSLGVLEGGRSGAFPHSSGVAADSGIDVSVGFPNAEAQVKMTKQKVGGR